MKTLKERLLESKKTYPFKIGIAGEVPEGFEARLKDGLEKFSIASMTKGKKTPIQEHPIDFPTLENSEVTFWDVELNYPTTDGVLREYLGNICKVNDSHIVVRNPNGPIERRVEEDEDNPYEALLTKEELDSESGQDSVADNRVMELLKELEKARKERNMGDSGFVVEPAKPESENKKSVVGK